MSETKHTEGKLKFGSISCTITPQRKIDNIIRFELEYEGTECPIDLSDKILHRYNCHEDLVEALKKFTEPEGAYSTGQACFANTIEMIKVANAAIAKAEKK